MKAGELLKVGAITGKGQAGAWICALGLVICLTGCQSGVNKAPALPSAPPPAAAASPRPVRPTFYVAINQLSLRVCPGKDCQKISTLELNTEVEKMGEADNWAQIKVKKDGTIGYVSSRHLSPKPVQAAQLTKKKTRKAKLHKAAQSPAAVAEAGETGEAGPKKQEPEPPLPRVM